MVPNRPLYFSQKDASECFMRTDQSLPRIITGCRSGGCYCKINPKEIYPNSEQALPSRWDGHEHQKTRPSTPASVECWKKAVMLKACYTKCKTPKEGIASEDSLRFFRFFLHDPSRCHGLSALPRFAPIFQGPRLRPGPPARSPSASREARREV